MSITRSLAAKMRRVGALLSVVAVATGLAACGGAGGSNGGASGSGGGGGGKKIGVAMYALDDPLFLGIVNGAKSAAADYGVDINFRSANGSLSSEISIVQNFISQHVDAIMVDPIDAKGILPVIKQAERAKIPVVTMGNKVNSAWSYSMLYPDYQNMAEEARILATAIGKQGQVALLVGAPGNYVSDTRQAGFTDTVKREFPKIDIVATEPTGYDPAKAQSVTQTLLQRYPHLKAIAAITDPLAEASIAAAQSAHRNGLQWTGYNGDPQMEPYLLNGTTLVDALTGSTRIGYWFAAAAARIANGHRLPHTMYIKTYLASGPNTISQLHHKGYHGKLIPVAREATIRESYAQSFGPKVPDAAMNAGNAGNP